jgi:hypothetical protein
VTRTRPVLRPIAVLVLVACAALAVAGPGTANAKKKKKKVGGTVNASKTLNQGIPDFNGTTYGLLTSTINVGKKFKGLVIRDVNVHIQTTGNTPGSDGSAEEIFVSLSAPNGTTTWLFGSLFGPSIGPLTIDDESVNALQTLEPPAREPTRLAAPYAGTAQPDCYDVNGSCLLAAMDGGPVKGSWTLRAYDVRDPGQLSTLNSWGIKVQTGKPYQS